MIEESMRLPSSSRALFGILFIVAALIGTPLAIFQLQQQQEIRQRADTSIAWDVSQTAATICPPYGTGANINVTFNNEEDDRSSLSMNVIATDKQTGKFVNLGSIRGGQTKSGVIQTGRATLSANSVTFALKWTDGRSGIDSKTASYKAISNCYAAPTPTPTKPYSTPYPPTPTVTPYYPTPSPTYPPAYPSPTICPTLGPVQNVRIDCPNCPNY